ncbi:MAG: isoquinoline 1-oxidoreductase, partial [Calditrichaeota bacterium]
MKEEQFWDLEYEDIAAPMTFDRREFLKLLGGGIVILFTTVDVLALPQERRRRRGFNYPTDFNAYLRIGEDGRVTCFTGKIE